MSADFFNYRLGPSAISSILNFMERAASGQLRTERINRQRSKPGVRQARVDSRRCEAKKVKQHALHLLRTGLAPAEVARICGCSRSSVFNWKNEL